MRAASIVASVVVLLVGGAVVHLQATPDAPATPPSTKTTSEPVYLMGAAHIPGFNDTEWRTSLELCNFGGVSRTFELALLLRGQPNPEPDTVALSLTPGRCVNYSDAVVSVFGFDEAVGTIRLTADGDGVVAVARTYNDTPDGTYGTSLGAIPASRAVGGDDVAVLVHLAQSGEDHVGYRSNLDLVNVGELEIDVEVELYGAAGDHLGTVSNTLEPSEYRQITRVFRQVTGGEVADGYAVIRADTADGALLASASLVDNRTGDTTTIEANAVTSSERWLEPINMGSPVNSAGDEWYPIFARDGSFMIFVASGRGGYGSGDLYISRFVAGEWTSPENMGTNVNTAGMDSAPYLSANDRTLYYTSESRPGAGTADIYSCPLDDGVAGPRTALPSPINAGPVDCCPVLSPDGNTIFICSDRSGGYGNLDVWMSVRVGGQWQPMVNLGPEINTEWFESPRWLSDDGRTLIIDSNRPGRIGGFDLWAMTKNGDEWLAPVNLGGPINSRSNEWGPGFLNNQGAVGGRICFGSGRSGGSGGWDLWCSDLGAPVLSAAVTSPTGRPARLRAVSVAAMGSTAETAGDPPAGNGCCCKGSR